MTKLGEIKKPWEKWSDETDLSYSYFISYLEIGPCRSLPKVCQKYTKKDSYISQLKKWSSRYDWVDRCRAYDDHLILRSLRNKERLMDLAHARLWKMVNQALDTYEDILILDNVIYVGEGSTTTMNERFKVVKDILDRLGVNFAVKEGPPPSAEMPTYQQINAYYYNKMMDEAD